MTVGRRCISKVSLAYRPYFGGFSKALRSQSSAWFWDYLRLRIRPRKMLLFMQERFNMALVGAQSLCYEARCAETKGSFWFSGNWPHIYLIGPRCGCWWLNHAAARQPEEHFEHVIASSRQHRRANRALTSMRVVYHERHPASTAPRHRHHLLPNYGSLCAPGKGTGKVLSVYGLASVLTTIWQQAFRPRNLGVHYEYS